MNTYFVFSDVHGEYDKLMKALDESGFDINNDSHIIISDGDLFDRGKKSKECLDFVMSMLEKKRAIVIMGNHDLRLYDLMFKNKIPDRCDVHNGVPATINSFINAESSLFWFNEAYISSSMSEISYETKEKLYEYFMSALWYVENDEYIITHGWLPTFDIIRKLSGRYFSPKEHMEKWREAPYEDWYNAIWSDTKSLIYGMYHNDENYYNEDKKLIIGHFWANELHTVFDNEVRKKYLEKQKSTKSISPVLEKDNLIAIDGMSNLESTSITYRDCDDNICAFEVQGKVNVYKFMSDKEFKGRKALGQ